MKIEEQKRLREEILKQKELRRQQQAGARKRELLERLAQQQQQQPPTQQSFMQQEEESSELPANGNPFIPHPGMQARQNVKNRLLVKKPDMVISNIQPKPTDFPQAGANMQFQGQPVKTIKQVRQTRPVPQGQLPLSQKPLPTKPAAGSLTPAQTARVASIQGRPQDLKPGVKRTVVQRANSGSGDGPHVGTKVRVIKLSGGVSFQGSYIFVWFVMICFCARFILCNLIIQNELTLERKISSLEELVVCISEVYFQNYRRDLFLRYWQV